MISCWARIRLWADSCSSCRSSSRMRISSSSVAWRKKSRSSCRIRCSVESINRWMLIRFLSRFCSLAIFIWYVGTCKKAYSHARHRTSPGKGASERPLYSQSNLFLYWEHKKPVHQAPGFLSHKQSFHTWIKIKGYSLSGQFPEIIHYKCFHTARIISQPYLQDFHFSPSKRFINLSYLETSRVNSFFMISHLSFYCFAQRLEQCRRMRSAYLFPESWPYCKGAVPVPESVIQKGR